MTDARIDLTASFFYSAKLYPRRPALMWIGGGVSYARLAQSVEVAARRLHDQGLRPGQLAAIAIRDAHLHIVALLALMRLGVASVSLAPGQDDYLSRGHVTCVVGDLPAGVALAVFAPSPDWLTASASEPAEMTGFESGEALFRVRLTSGATGRPEPVAMCAADAREWMSRKRPFDEEGRVLSMFGLSAGIGVRALLRSIGHGGTFCIAGAPQEACDTIQLCLVEHVVASVAQLAALAECARQAGAPPSSLKSVLTGGSLVSDRVVAAAQRYLCSNVLIAYGAAELGLVSLTPATAAAGRPGASGYLFPDVEAEAVGDDGARLPPGAHGRLRLRWRGAHSAQALSPSPYRTFRNDWFEPGDLGAVDPDGMLIVSGRASEVINAGGVKVAPELIDEALLQLQGMRDAAAFAVPGAAGDEIWAAIVTEHPPDIPALLALARDKLGARAPAYLVRVAGIPRNAAGKILRHRLAGEIEALRGARG